MLLYKQQNYLYDYIKLDCQIIIGLRAEINANHIKVNFNSMLRFSDFVFGWGEGILFYKKTLVTPCPPTFLPVLKISRPPGHARRR